jgi:hypothetical protein
VARRVKPTAFAAKGKQVFLAKPDGAPTTYKRIK